MDVGDLEKSGDRLAKPKTSATAPPLMLGRYPVPPQALFRFLVSAFCVTFFVYRAVDLIFFLTVDGRFPEGLDYQYSSDYERLQTVAYTRQMLGISMLKNTVTFCVVLALVCTPALANLDDLVRKGVPKVGEWCARAWECLPWCITAPVAYILNLFLCICEPFWRALKCCCSCICVCGWEPQWTELFYGAIFLTLLGTFFAIIVAPFKLWRYAVDVEFGFANVLTTSPDEMRAGLISGIGSSIMTGIPTFMLYLAVLKCRFAWLLMWAAMCVITVVALFNVAAIAPLVFDASVAFPDDVFGVGSQFPLLGSAHNVSLNRIYYTTEDKDRLITRDLSGNALALAKSDAGNWILRGASFDNMKPTVFAETEAAQTIYPVPESGTDDLPNFEEQSWEMASGGAGKAELVAGRIGMRDGRKLRRELLDFAEKVGTHITQVYMIDGSHQDSRANAFAAGAGGSRIIGLYDTLFLGDQPAQDDLSLINAPPTSVEAKFSIQDLSKLIRGVHTETPTPMKKARRSTPSVAMTDNEILAIMGHEMGHSAMHHSEEGLFTQAVSSFLTFAMLGWIVHCPVLAAAFGFGAPMAHIALFFYDHVANPPLESLINIVDNYITRQNEYAADVYAARVSETYASAMQSALQKLTVNCNQDPSVPWFYEMLYYDHPTTAHRWARVEQVKRELYAKDDDKSLENVKAAALKHSVRKGT